MDDIEGILTNNDQAKYCLIARDKGSKRWYRLTNWYCSTQMLANFFKQFDPCVTECIEEMQMVEKIVKETTMVVAKDLATISMYGINLPSNE